MLISSAGKVFWYSRNYNKKSSYRKETKHWFGKQCKISRGKYLEAKRTFKSSRSLQNKCRLINASKNYKKCILKYSKLYTKILQEKISNVEKSDPRSFWKLLKQKSTDNENLPENESFFNFFKNVNEGLDDDFDFDIEQIKNSSTEESTVLNRLITKDEIMACIHNLKNNKAAGFDNIINEYITSTKDVFINIYVKLFNMVLDTGIFPEKWLVGIIKPIYKNKGDPKLPGNYRPITLLSCFGKLFTSVINRKLYSIRSSSRF